MAKNIVPPPKQTILQRFTTPGKILTYMALAILLVLVAVPHGLRIGLTRWLHDAGVAKAEIEDVDFNPFLGRLALKAVRLSNQERVGLRAGEMVVTFEWWPLWQGRFKVKNLQIEEGSFALRHLAEGRWRIGGIPLDPSTEATDSTDAVGTAANSWDFGAENITIKNMVVSFHELHWQEEVTLVTAKLENLATWEKDGAALFSVKIDKKPGTLHLSGEIKPFAPEAILQAKLKMERFPLKVLAPLLAAQGTDRLQGAVTAELAIKATYDQSQKTFYYESIDTLQLIDAVYQSASAQFHSVELYWQGSSRGDMSLAEEQFTVIWAGSLAGSPLSLHLASAPYQLLAEQLAVQGEVSIRRAGKGEDTVATTYQLNGKAKGLQIHDPAQDLNIAHLSRLSVDSATGSNGKIAIKKLQGREFQLLQRGKDKELTKSQQEYMVAVKEISLENLDVSEQGFVSIGKVRLQNGEGVLVRNSQGQMEYSQGQAAQPEETQEATTPAKGGGLRIGNLYLTGQNQIIFEDHFLKVPYKETFDQLILEVGELDSRQPQLKTPVSLESGIGAYASLALAGTISPFSTTTTMDLKGTMSSLDLPSLNPYADQYLFYRMESGQLDADIVIKVDDGVMDSEANLLLEKLKVKKVREGEDRFQKITGFPFQYTVDLLRDKKDDIRFRLPVKGDIRNPDFQFGDVVTKAVVAGIKKTTLSYYAPLGVTLLTGVSLPVGTLYVSGQVIDWVTALSFKPVGFVNGSPELSEENRQYLDSIAKLLGNRPKVRVVLCGKANLAEFGNGGSASEKQLSEKIDDLPVSKKTELLELAANRALKVKEYLVEQGIEAKRLILCEPGIDSKPANGPRVDISI